MAEWLYGRNPVFETLRAGRRQALALQLAEGLEHTGRLPEILEFCRSKSVPLETLPRHELDRHGDPHQGVAVKVGDYPYSDLPDILALAEARREPPFLLILDALQDPQNLGALLRTAEAFGVHGVLLPLRHAVGVTPAVVAASSGASEHLLIARSNLSQAIDALKKDGVWVVGLDAGPGAQPPSQVRLDGALALVVGSEGSGMRRLVRESCDLLMRLPMQGQIESLNAAVAGSIALYLASAARPAPNPP